MSKVIYCSECKKDMLCNKTTGKQIYPHRKDLYKIVIWECPKCKNYVGSHKSNGEPLGIIANKKIKYLRIKIHAIIDPLWREGLIKRCDLYKLISNKLGYIYHTANVKTVEECAIVLSVCREIKKGLNNAI